MKKVLFGILFVSIIFWSCDESPTKLSSDDFIIKLVDSISKEPMEDYSVELSYKFEEMEIPDISFEEFYVYPNPVTSMGMAHITMLETSKLFIQAENIVAKHIKNIYGPFDAAPGTYQFEVNLNDDSLFNQGLFRIYSNVNDVKRDSANFIRIQLNDLHDFINNKTLLIDKLTSNTGGIVNPELNFGIWIGEKFYRSLDNGQVVQYLKITENIGIKVYNKENQIVKELVIPFDELKKGRIIIEINK